MRLKCPHPGIKMSLLLRLIRGERTDNPIGVENGLRVIQLTEAAWQSAELGRPGQGGPELRDRTHKNR